MANEFGLYSLAERSFSSTGFARAGGPEGCPPAGAEIGVSPAVPPPPLLEALVREA